MRSLLEAASTRGSRLTGFAAILSVMGIYAINIAVTRWSVLNGLTSLDLTALRFAVAGTILLPYFYRLGLKDLGGVGWPKALLLFCLAGAPYLAVFLYGLGFAPASHGAVLNPAIVPSVVFIGLVFLGLQSFSTARAIALASIILGVLLVAASSFALEGPVLFGDFLLLCTGVSWGIFTLCAKLWRLRPMQCTAIVSVISLSFLPPYMMFAYNGFADASMTHVVLQAIFQGVVNSIATLYLVTYAVQRLGAQLTSLFSPLVPVLTALLAIPLLGEIPTALQWFGVLLVVAGMLGAARMNSE